MSEATSTTGFTRRLFRTPMLDLVRLRVTGRLDVEAHVHRASLPEPATNLILRVSKHTRLWPIEKLDVADELIAHFKDAMESGESVEAVITAFGHEKHAARLIRRAKFRNRHMIWHIRLGIQWLMTVTVAVYLLMLSMIFTGHPSPSVDYVAQLNAPIASALADQLAWPLYRQALVMQIALRPEQFDAQKKWDEMFDARPGSKRWPELAAWVDSNQQIFELIHRGADKPMLGFVYGAGGSADDPGVYSDPNNAEHGDWLMFMLGPDGQLRRLASLLASDAAVAAERNDADRFIRDVGTMLHVSGQSHDLSIRSDLFRIGGVSMALDLVDKALDTHKPALSEKLLQELAHRIRWPKTASELISFEPVRRDFHDFVQRTYTDDGKGDGRITGEGISFLGAETKYLLPSGALSPLVASRRTIVQEVDRHLDTVQGKLAVPYRDASWESYEQEWFDRLGAIQRNTISSIRLSPLWQMMPTLSRAAASAERAIAERDGIMVRIALEVYFKQHGYYPASLEELVPRYLPRVPTDRINGKPVHYRIRDGQPIIYSDGVDGDDDGGVPPRDKYGNLDNWAAAIGPRSGPMPDGDWILFPRPRSSYVEPDEAP